tara:strand:- start:104 stop:949 length:846 start_codon:yes stop_codon:yes gene_type:complete
MAETFTYDPSNDPEAIAAAEARDAESLKVGEELVEKQENLLAGKYKNPEELEKAYLELQKKQGTQPESEPQSEEAPNYEDRMYTEEGGVNYDTANELYGDNLGELFKANEIDPFEMNKYFAENNGTLSEDMYDQLESAGLNRTLVDSYLEGLRTQMGGEPQQVLSESDVEDIKAISGGDKAYDNLMEWAGSKLSKQDAKDYDDVLATGNKTAITFAVKALMAQYENANGRDPKLVTGKQSAPERYRSMAEVTRDMAKPEYRTDEAYRDDVLRKLAASNLNV